MLFLRVIKSIEFVKKKRLLPCVVCEKSRGFKTLLALYSSQMSRLVMCGCVLCTRAVSCDWRVMSRWNEEENKFWRHLAAH